MDFERRSKVHNLVVIQLNNSKLGQMTNLKIVFHIMVSIYKLDKICNLTQFYTEHKEGDQVCC